jgi:hypothetical protein
MDGTPQVVRFDVTTLWHLDAAEWAPSTASMADIRPHVAESRMSALRPKADKRADVSLSPLSAISGCEQSQQDHPLFDHLVGAS